MAEDWLKQQADITNDLRNDGIEFTIKRKGESVYDPISGQYLSNDEEQTFTAYGIFKKIGTNVSWFQGTSIEQGDKMVLLDCSTYKPELTDYFVLNDGEWAVKNMAHLEPGGVSLIQYILLRKA